MDDSFAEKALGCKKAAEIPSKVEEIVTNEINNQIHTLVKIRLFNKLEDLLTYDIPPTLLKREVDALKQETKKLKDSESESLDSDYCERFALRRIKIGLLLSEYAKNHKIQVTNDDIKEAILHKAKSMPYLAQQIIKLYNTNEDARNSLMGTILEEKAVRKIIDVEIAATEKEYSIKELDASLEKEQEVLLSSAS